MLNPILRYRGLIHAITVRDIKSRYAGSTFGAAWLLLPPIFMVFIYTVVFASLMKARLPGIEHQYAYSIYLCAGLIAWNLMLELVQRGKTVFLEHANLIKKSTFPKFILFIPVVAVAVFNSAILLLLVLAFMLVSGYPVSWGTLMIIPVLMVTTLLGLAVGALLSVLTVFFRDTNQISDVIFQMLFWATPIVYPVSILPPRAQEILGWNPLFGIVEVAHHALLNEAASWRTLGYPLGLGVAILVLAVLFYRRTYADLLDQI